MTDELGRIEKVDVRTIWKNEERDFSPWLKRNINLLSEKVEFGIDDIELEQNVGRFSRDLFGKMEGSERFVVIENQFGETDHDHLGKLLTYMSGKSAKVGVWIAEKFREEHIATLEFLNENSSRDGTALFGVEVEIKRIGNSAPAPEFTVVVQPNEWQKSISQEESESDRERHQKRLAFFEKLVERYKEVNPGWNKVKPQPQNWLSFGAGRGGLAFGWVFKLINGFRFSVELSIDTKDEEENRRILNHIKQYGSSIEKSLGLALEFQEAPGSRACRIEVSTPTGTAFTKLSDEKKSELVEWGAKTMLAFSGILSKYIKET